MPLDFALCKKKVPNIKEKLWVAVGCDLESTKGPTHQTTEINDKNSPVDGHSRPCN